MLIQDMAVQASIDLMVRVRLGRLACAHEGQPYITPLYWQYDSNYLYSFSTVGQKINWMRANPLVCVEFEELVSPQNWATVIVSGRYEELPDQPSHNALRKHAYDLLQTRPVWWEPGYVKTVLSEKSRPMEYMYFRIHIDRLSGHRGVPDSVRGVSATDEGAVGWLRRILGLSQHL